MGSLDEIKREVRAQAECVAAEHEAVLESWGAGSGALRRPVALEYRRGRGYVSVQAANWDWFYALHPAEQARLRQGWLSAGDGALAPDELGATLHTSDGEAMAAWLAHTRIVDACRALARGRLPRAVRYGGLSLNAVLDTPYDVAVLFGGPEQAAEHVAMVEAELESGVYGAWDRLALTDPVERYRQAARLEAEAERQRSRAVEELLASGKSVAQIAEMLGISRQAANTHAARVRRAAELRAAEAGDEEAF